MKNLLKERFALTEQGTSDLIKSSLASFFCYVVNMLPAMLLMLFFNQLVFEKARSNEFYWVFSAFTLIAVYTLLNMEYNSLYTATYKESENLRIDIAETMRNLSLSYFSKHDLSDLTQTIMKDVTTIEHALSHAIPRVIGYSAFFIILSVLLLIGNFKLGLAVILPIALNISLTFLSKGIQVRNFTRYYQKLRNNAESFQETIELQQEIKSLGMSEDIKNKLYKEMEESEKIHIESEFIIAMIINIAASILYLSIVGVIILGARLLINGEINLIYFIGYLLASMKLKDGMDNIGMHAAEIFNLNSMVNRINEIRKTKTQEGKEVELSNYDIMLKNVGFGYNEDFAVLKDISFTAKQNEVTALVGKSGCGKTSILRLVSRLYDYNSGSIEISGKDIKEISTKSLFDKVSIVFQDVILFNESILENIRIGNLNATDDEVKEAARLANCEEFINKLPKAYETEIGENGATLSGGERQRLSIARAFLKNSPIIILDEIAASLDVGNEKKIQESLNRLTRGKTVIVISHRLKSIEKVDKIVVIDEGHIESVGSHEQLLTTSEIYKNLVKKNKMAEDFVY